MSLIDKVKHAAEAAHLIETDPTADSPSKVPSTQIATPSYVGAVPLATNPPTSWNPSASPDSKYYSSLLEKTNPTAGPTPNLQKVFTLAKPLESIVLDRTTRMKAAIAQAGVTVEVITSETQKLIDVLQAEGQNFQRELERKKLELGQKQTQANTLEQQLHDLRADISATANKIDQANVDFQGAYGRRQSELQQLKSESSNWR